MLSYELYLKNKDSSGGDVKSLKPIKKMILKNDSWVVDTKTIEEYGSSISTKFSSIQNWLSMPLSTTDPEVLNLPDKRTSPAQPSPYILIYGTLNTNKSKESTLSLSIGKKPSIIEHTLDLKTKNVSSKESKVKIKLEKKNYLIDGKNIFDLYVESKIVNKDGMIDNQEYKKIINTFFEFVNKRKLENPPFGKSSFAIYLIPSTKKVSLEAKNTTTSTSNSFTDSFGNSSKNYASSSTKTSKFLSFDDKAFTLNCKQGNDFYQNIGIGDESLDKIYFPKEQTFTISQFQWVFTDISSNNTQFIETKRGIYSQLYENYKILSKLNPTQKEKAQLKIISYKQQQAKQEILIDENLTMEKMKRMFENIEEEKIPFHAFEVLIESVGKSVLWNNYLYAIKNFLAESKIPKSYLLRIFTKMLRVKIHEWIKSKTSDEQKDFFTQSGFCLKTLTIRNSSENIMNFNEEFAFSIGQIARNYIEFKQKIREESSSLKDILTYSKYDREKLRFVLQRIGIGVNLAKADTTEITKTIEKLYPKKEIVDEESHKDYSYFFYKGYYTKEILA